MVESICGLDLLLSLVLAGGYTCGYCCNAGHSVLSFFQFGYCDVAGVDGNLVRGSIGFVLGDFVDVDGPLLSVNLDDFSFVALSGSSKNDDLIVLSDGEGPDSVFVSE